MMKKIFLILAIIISFVFNANAETGRFCGDNAGRVELQSDGTFRLSVHGFFAQGMYRISGSKITFYTDEGEHFYGVYNHGIFANGEQIFPATIRILGVVVKKGIAESHILQ